jgi:hypothetical protein
MKFFKSSNAEEKGQIFFCKVNDNNYMTLFQSWASIEATNGHDEAQVTKQLAEDWYNNPINRPEMWTEIDHEAFSKLKEGINQIFEQNG